MEEYKVTGVIIQSCDYKENDKLVTIFSLELGKISAQLKGVKKNNAKLKYAGLPFCFGAFYLTKTGDYFTITQVDLIDTFFDITKDYSKTLIGSDCLKICNFLLKPNLLNESLFLNLLNTLKLLAYDQVNENLVMTKFILNTFSSIGYNMQFERCNNCNSEYNMGIYLNEFTGDFLCNNCKNNDCVSVTKQEYNTLKIISFTDYTGLKNIKIKENVIKNSLLLLKNTLNNMIKD